MMMDERYVIVIFSILVLGWQFRAWVIRGAMWLMFWLLIWGLVASFATVCLYGARDLVQFLIKP